MGDSTTINELMKKDVRLSEYYNKKMANGKWDGMMSDNHIGYTQWSIPEKNRNPMTLGFKVEQDLNATNQTDEYAIPAYQYIQKNEEWIFLPDLGKGKGCMGISKVTMPSATKGEGPAMEYEVNLNDEGKIAIGILPTQDVYPARGLRIGVKIDDMPMQVIDARQGLHDEFQEYTQKNLAVSKVLKALPKPNHLLLSGYWKGHKLIRRDEVFDNMRWLEVDCKTTPGKHKLKIIMIDPEIVVEKLVINPAIVR